MDMKVMILSLFLLVLMIALSEAGHKKVVIHVPYKIKKLKHTHTVYKTVHHYQPHHHHHHHHSKKSHHHPTHLFDEGFGEHEHFHHGGELHGFHTKKTKKFH